MDYNDGAWQSNFDHLFGLGKNVADNDSLAIKIPSSRIISHG